VINSEKAVRKLLKNLDNSYLHCHQQVCLDNQTHVVNFNRHQMQDEKGLRHLCLKRNHLGNKFADEF
jgi:hypothetical protein